MSATVLVADHDPFNLRLLQEVCESVGYHVITAADGTQVLDMVARETPDLVLLESAMPPPDGFEVLRILKADDDLRHIPVLLVTPDGDAEAKGRGILLGADDYISQPYRVFEIQQRMRNALDLGRARKSLPPEMADPSMQTGNLAQLHMSLEYEYTRALRYRRPLSFALARLSNLTVVLESRGAAATDLTLTQLGRGLRGCIRTVDHIFRSRPDEFALILPETDALGADTVVARIRDAARDGKLWPDDVGPSPDLRVACVTTTFGANETGASLRMRAAQLLQ